MDWAGLSSGFQRPSRRLPEAAPPRKSGAPSPVELVSPWLTTEFKPFGHAHDGTTFNNMSSSYFSTGCLPHPVHRTDSAQEMNQGPAVQEAVALSTPLRNAAEIKKHGVEVGEGVLQGGEGSCMTPGNLNVISASATEILCDFRQLP